MAVAAVTFLVLTLARSPGWQNLLGRPPYLYPTSTPPLPYLYPTSRLHTSTLALPYLYLRRRFPVRAAGG